MKTFLPLFVVCTTVLSYSFAERGAMGKVLIARDHMRTPLLPRSPTKQPTKKPTGLERQDQGVPGQSSPEHQESQPGSGPGRSGSGILLPWDNPEGTRDGAPFRWHARVGGEHGYQGYIDNYTRSRSNSPSTRGHASGQVGSSGKPGTIAKLPPGKKP